LFNNLIYEEKRNLKGQIIRDSRFMTRSSFIEPKLNETYPLLGRDIEQEIALAFDRKDIVQLSTLFINIERNNIFIKKAKNSPLYLQKKLNSLEKELGLIQTAIYLLVTDENTKLSEITKAYNLLNNYNQLEKYPAEFKNSFEKRLDIFESIKKKNSILDKLREAQNDLGFNNLSIK
jgi:hypothetical protein